jgi:putative hydrolase of the HAD superfamily
MPTTHSSAPQVIYFDAVGTLFGVRDSVGEIYSQLAAEAGISADPTALNKAFFKSFSTAPKAAFPGATPAEIPALEFDWWLAIAQHTFTQVGLLEQIPDFKVFFKPLFDHFATAYPWVIYDEVPEVLAHWQASGVQLGIISNFDSRLHQVLEVLNLAQYFSSVTISTAVGAAKPDPQIFLTALAGDRCMASCAWHVGDSWEEDVRGAAGAGLRAIWLDRDAAKASPEQSISADVIRSLRELSTLSIP